MAIFSFPIYLYEHVVAVVVLCRLSSCLEAPYICAVAICGKDPRRISECNDHVEIMTNRFYVIIRFRPLVRVMT
jgi:hypothetical protein